MARRFVVPGRLKAAPHLLSFRTHQSQETLLQVVVAEKTNEIPIAQALLPCLPICSGASSQQTLCIPMKDFMLMHEYALGGKRFSPSKATSRRSLRTWQPTLPIPMARCQQAETWDRRRGRMEHRIIQVSTEMNIYLAPAWPLIQQVAEVSRRHRSQDRTKQP